MEKEHGGSFYDKSKRIGEGGGLNQSISTKATKE